MEFERAQAYAREAGRTYGWEQGVAEGREQGIETKALDDAVMLVKDFNIDPEVAAQKVGANLDALLKRLA